MDIVEPQTQDIEEAGQVVPMPHDFLETPNAPTPMPFLRTHTFLNMIHRWVPMGIRVVMNLPFIGNDQTAVFGIRHNPYIPWLGEGLQYPFFQQANLGPVKITVFGNSDKNLVSSPVSVTQHSPPPLLSVLARAHRRWRGSMMYRFRTVTNFTVQGYVRTGIQRNQARARGVADPLTSTIGVDQQDYTLSEAWYNSYNMSDVSMFRHLEVKVPFEYPVPYYDQFMYYLSGSDRAASQVITDTSVSLPPVDVAQPFGDNYLVLAVVGQLAAADTSNQLMFELEYKPGDDFQFADPFLVPAGQINSKRQFGPEFYPTPTTWNTTVMNFICPDPTHSSDGFKSFRS